MGIGENFRSQVTKVIDKYGTEVLLMDVTPVKNAYGSITSYVVNGTGTVKAVPSNFFQNKLGRHPFGNLNEGEVRMLFPAGTSFTNLKGTADSWRAVLTINNFKGTYVPKEEKPIPLAGVNVAIPVVFVLEEESGY